MKKIFTFSFMQVGRKINFALKHQAARPKGIFKGHVGQLLKDQLILPRILSIKFLQISINIHDKIHHFFTRHQRRENTH